MGSLCGGVLPSLARLRGATPIYSYRTVVISYAAFGIVLMLAFLKLSPATEMGVSDDPLSGPVARKTLLGVGQSRKIVLRLSALFALDSFGGGFVVQSFAAYWFYLRFGVSPAALGAIFFGANLFAGISALLASRLASRIGLVKTMVFTHLPSNILLLTLPLMPTLRHAIGVLLLRFSISQMDVPTRQSYTMAVVKPEERSAAAGITGVARTVGATIPPIFVGWMFAHPSLINIPFFIAGTLKIAYDLLLYRQFVAVQPPEEKFR
jgi:predicted MFS family arabinose efflux permease